VAPWGEAALLTFLMVISAMFSKNPESTVCSERATIKRDPFPAVRQLVVKLLHLLARPLLHRILEESTITEFCRITAAGDILLRSIQTCAS
jgi:hypothetical protein